MPCYKGAGMIDAPLVCLPGFMGSGRDFNAVRQNLTQPSALVDWQWPDPGTDQHINKYAARCWEKFAEQSPDQFTLYAYSMGARITLHWLSNSEFQQRCRGLCIASAHTGLTSEDARSKRKATDAVWAKRFAREPLADCLKDWYQQPVFSSLTHTQKKQQIHSKLNQDPLLLSRQLQSASLGTQQDLTHTLSLFAPLTYVVGELDEKFLKLSNHFCEKIDRRVIAQAGHIAHAEQPSQLAQIITEVFYTGDQHT